MDDAAQIAAIYRPYCEENSVSFETEAPGPAEMAARIERTLRRYPWLVDVDDDGKVGGYAYASQHREKAAYRWAVELTIYLRADRKGRGIGSALYRELLGRLRGQGFFKAYAGILVPNPASQAFHEAIGFTLVGIYRGVGFKHGAWRDVGWWQLALQPEVDLPAEPTYPGTTQTATP
jgi:phosphinothricin acetyltransferase